MIPSLMVEFEEFVTPRRSANRIVYLGMGTSRCPVVYSSPVYQFVLQRQTACCSSQQADKRFELA